MAKTKEVDLRDLQVFDYAFEDKVKDGKADNGVLATLKGYVTFSGDKSNRNKHFYPARSKDGVQDGFWDKVLGGNSFIKERLDTKTFFGCSKHPEKGQTPIPEFGDQSNPISHVIKDFKIDDKGVWAEIDLMDTFGGREIYPFVKYGSKIGMSTRAYGSVKEMDDGYKTPNLDDYHFVTWDMVTFPAFSKTRMDAVQDSWGVEVEVGDVFDEKGFLKELKSMPYDDAKRICDYAGLKPEDALGQKPQSDAEGKALEDALERILELEKQLEGGSDKSKKQYSDKIMQLKDENSKLQKEIKKLQDGEKTEETEKDKTIIQLNNTIDYLKERVVKLRNDSKKGWSLVNELKQRVNDQRNKLRDQQEELEELQEIADNYEELKKKHKSLQKSFDQSKSSLQDSMSHRQNRSTVSVKRRSEPLYRAYDSDEEDGKDRKTDAVNDADDTAGLKETFAKFGEERKVKN